MTSGITVRICKGEPLGDNQPETTTIIIDGTIPEFDYRPPNPFAEAGRFYDQQAQMLFDALSNSLPGGTLDRLLGKMLAYKASHFRVLSWTEEKKEMSE